MEYEITLLTVISINVLLAISLNLITGLCGQVSIGHAAFYGVGAYTYSVLSVKGLPFPLALVAGGVTAGLVGLIVGLCSLRVRHDFLAITTMGVNILFLGFVRKQKWLGGELGVANIPSSELGAISFMLLVAALAVAVVGMTMYIKRSWMGISFTAVADDEDTARTVGILQLRSFNPLRAGEIARCPTDAGNAARRPGIAPPILAHLGGRDVIAFSPASRVGSASCWAARV